MKIEANTYLKTKLIPKELTKEMNHPTARNHGDYGNCSAIAGLFIFHYKDELATTTKF